MPYQRDLEPVSKQLTIIIGLTVVGFMTFGLALSFYRNILFQQTLNDLEQQNEQIAAGIGQEYRDLEYVNSDQYKDKYAKENLARVNDGEKVLLIAHTPKGILTGSGETLTEREQREAAYLELLRQMPVVEHWKLYLFHRDKLEELKKGL
ncbi:hypothetical protein HZA45_02385 [Candidatus Peregrinibacteria bacterium]|nr:hypothetical protein [Candidatus Peregrinibacteria bacterium]